MKFSGTLLAMGSSGGAILGGSIYGPIGAVIGAVTGVTISLIAGDEELSLKKRAVKDRSGRYVYKLTAPFEASNVQEGEKAVNTRMNYRKTDEYVK